MFTDEQETWIREKLRFVYGDREDAVFRRLETMLADRPQQRASADFISEKDTMLITYGGSIRRSGEKPLWTLHQFLKNHTADLLSAVHLLPFYPYTSDDGFSVQDYTAVDPRLGSWEEIQAIAGEVDVMFDAVINHISQASTWFQRFREGDPRYQDYFIVSDPEEDYSSVTRPRARPLLTPVQTAEGTTHVWTTFSEDQIDLNYANEDVFLDIVDILLFYVDQGADYLRLDAVGFMWKKLHTSCIHLDETHALIQLFRLLMDAGAPGTILITETNVPHEDNIAYFGDGRNEAHMVYQFPLPPLVLHSFHEQRTDVLSAWAETIEAPSEKTAFFNFLASHDGIGVVPAKGLLSEREIEAMAEKVKAHGGLVSYKDNGDGTQSPYELNSNYLDALSHPEEEEHQRAARFISAQSILLALQGMPGIYIHSLLGSVNDQAGVRETGRSRSINREVLDADEVEAALSDEQSLRHRIFHACADRIRIRTAEPAFHPHAPQTIHRLHPAVFCVERSDPDKGGSVYVIVNTSNKEVELSLPAEPLQNMLTNEKLAGDTMRAAPLENYWMKKM
ncbi:sugar phosphorylase [Alkalicoccus chagannorensis]|uniref:sugar phosphorylase n=1 Tax=Alkalicoccus chagannorensis TaxID=427072 RepID=UPI0004164E86|nr:sugar phosphorylase [Alkalicoccus chagannorensis]